MTINNGIYKVVYLTILGNPSGVIISTGLELDFI